MLRGCGRCRHYYGQSALEVAGGLQAQKGLVYFVLAVATFVVIRR